MPNGLKPSNFLSAIVSAARKVFIMEEFNASEITEKVHTPEPLGLQALILRNYIKLHV